MYNGRGVCSSENAIVVPQQAPFRSEPGYEAQQAVNKGQQAGNPEPGSMVNVGGSQEAPPGSRVPHGSRVSAREVGSCRHMGVDMLEKRFKGTGIEVDTITVVAAGIDIR